MDILIQEIMIWLFLNTSKLCKLMDGGIKGFVKEVILKISLLKLFGSNLLVNQNF